MRNRFEIGLSFVRFQRGFIIDRFKKLRDGEITISGTNYHSLQSVHKVSQSVMPDLIRHPEVVPTKTGNHTKDWVPVFTGNPGFRLSPRNDVFISFMLRL